MKVIMVYDINTEDKEGVKRLNKIRKTARKYLHHIQKSVFEGEMTEKYLRMLKKEIMKIIDEDKDHVIIYTAQVPSNIEKEILTNTQDKTSFIID